MDSITACGLVVIQNESLLVVKDKKDDFYKLPGGKPKAYEPFEDACRRELFEETGLRCTILEQLPSLHLDKKPGTGENVAVSLHHFKAKLNPPPASFTSYTHNDHEVLWLPLIQITQGLHAVSPNITFLTTLKDLS